MHQDDDNYDDDHDYDDSQNKYKHYFKFDPAAWDSWSKWLQDALNDMVENPSNVWYIGPKSGWSGFSNDKSLPVNSYFSNTGKPKNFQYLGNNYQSQPIWKTNYFLSNSIATEYLNHLKNNAVHFVLQPHYYKGMFDILN